MRRTRHAFTLVELMLVVAIMGMMGAISVGGYRAMRRGMEDRRVMQNVNQFIRNAYQRMQIDHVPTAIYFWNETRKEDSDDGVSSMIVVGRAVAVRQTGRITYVSGSYIADEFADFKYDVATDEDGEEETKKATNRQTFRLYPIDDSKNFRYSLVYTSSLDLSDEPPGEVKAMMTDPEWVDDHMNDKNDNNRIALYGYEIKSGDHDVTWKVGQAYGREFADLTLPNNYIFGNNYSKKIANPVTEIEKTCFFPDTPNKSFTIAVKAMRPDSQGELKPIDVETTVAPGDSLQKQLK